MLYIYTFFFFLDCEQVQGNCSALDVFEESVSIEFWGAISPNSTSYDVNRTKGTVGGCVA